MPQWLTTVVSALQDEQTKGLLLVAASVGGAMAAQFIREYKAQRKKISDAPVIERDQAQKTMAATIVGASHSTFEILTQEIAGLRHDIQRLLARLEAEAKEEELRELEERMMQKLVDKIRSPGGLSGA